MIYFIFKWATYSIVPALRSNVMYYNSVATPFSFHIELNLIMDLNATFI